MKHYKQKKKVAGVTLIEILLYVSLMGMVLLAIVSTLFLFLGSREKSNTITEVAQQGAFVLGVITDTVKDSTGIQTPATSTASTTLTLAMETASIDPTVFRVSSSGTLEMIEGSDSPIPLTGAPVIVESFKVHNLSASGTKGSVRVQFTLSRFNPDNRRDYEARETFYGSADVR